MQSLRRSVAAAIILICILAAPAQAAPDISATAAILINGRTGDVLWQKNGHQQMYPASTTKILTTILLLEQAAADETAVTSRLASATRGSSLYLSPGQEIQVQDLLYGLMLQSANDGSVVAAEHVAGSVETFAAMMNMKAKQLGALNSHFTNPHGLPDDDHVTTAYDLAMITRYAMADAAFREIAASRRYSLPWPDGETRVLTNRIPLLSSYEGMLGIKTGYTVAAKRTFVGAAERDGLELIVVVLQASGNQLWEDTAALLDYGFTNFRHVQPLRAGDTLGTVPVRFGEAVLVQAADDFELTCPYGSEEITIELNMDETRVAPLARGEVLGEAVVLLSGEPVGRVDVVAADDVARAALATGRFWVASFFCTLAGLRVRKVYRRRKRKKMRFVKKELRQFDRKFR